MKVDFILKLLQGGKEIHSFTHSFSKYLLNLLHVLGYKNKQNRLDAFMKKMFLWEKIDNNNKNQSINIISQRDNVKK